jgi:hypothetical protein
VLVQMGWAKTYPVMGYSDPIRIGPSIGFIFFGYLLDTYPPCIRYVSIRDMYPGRIHRLSDVSVLHRCRLQAVCEIAFDKPTT